MSGGSSSVKGSDGGGSVSVVSWTGGKDGCLAAYRAICEGRKIGYLLSFWNMTRQGAHEVNPEVLFAQAEAMGVPLIRTGFASYEEEFKRVVRSLTRRGMRTARARRSIQPYSATSGPTTAWWSGSATTWGSSY